MSAICLLLAHLATSGLDAGEASFAKGPYAQGLVDPIVAQRGGGSSEDWPNDGITGRWTRLKQGTTIGGVDCSKEFTAASVPLARSSANGPDVPRLEEMGRILFLPVVISKDGKTALVRWRYYYHSLNAGGHFAVMDKGRGGWTVSMDGRDGPIS